MKNAIKLLQREIEKVQAEKVKVQERIDEPEMPFELEFATNDMANLELLELEYTNAMATLAKKLK